MKFPKDMSEELKDELFIDELIYGNSFYYRCIVNGKYVYERVDPTTINFETFK